MRAHRSDEIPPIVFVSDALLEETARLLASFAIARDSEGVVYWFGLEFGGRAVVTTLVVPDADTRYGCVSTSAAANAEAVSVVVDTPLVLLGQAHSHPSSLVGHSRVDDEETFAQFSGTLSVVVPFYGRTGMRLDECGVHRHVHGRYRRIRGKRVAEHIRTVKGTADFRRDT